MKQKSEPAKRKPAKARRKADPVKRETPKRPRNKSQLEKANEARRKYAEAQEVDEFKEEQRLRKEYEKDRPDLAPWVGIEAYLEARKVESRLKEVGMIGALMGGAKRTEVRERYRVSSHKLTRILNSEVVDDILKFSLGQVFSFQTAAVKAIMQSLEAGNGALAMQLFDKMGLWDRMREYLRKDGDAEGAQNTEALIAVLLSKNPVQARQALEEIGRLVVESFKGEQPDADGGKSDKAGGDV